MSSLRQQAGTAALAALMLSTVVLADTITITNPTAVNVTVPYTQTTHHVVATNTGIVGDMAVIVNHRVTNWYPAANPLTGDVALVVGPNLVRVVGTNSLGEEASDGVVINRRNYRGRLVAWGWNEYCQTDCPTGSDYVAIGAASYHNVAIKDDGSLVAWGDNSYGQTDCPTGNNYSAVAGRGVYSLALKTDGSLTGWGSSPYGALNYPAGIDYVAIAAGAWHGVALKADGSLVAWGDNWCNQTNCPPGNNYVAVSSGPWVGVALRDDGSLVPWGGYWAEQTNCPPGNDYIAIAGGNMHSIALRSDGTLVPWGDNMYGMTNCPGGSDFAAVACDTFHDIALKRDGSLVGWGSNDYGQVDCPAGNNHLAIAESLWHSLAIQGGPMLMITNPPVAYSSVAYDVTHYAVAAIHDEVAGNIGVIVNGGATNWQAACNPFVTNIALSMGPNTVRLVATNSMGMWGVDRVVVSRQPDSRGVLVAWGDNSYGETSCPAGNDYVAVAAGEWHSVALKTDGSLVAWGINVYGQINCPAGNDYVAVAAGNMHSIALRSNAALVAWGGNWYGQTDCPAETNYVAMAGGYSHSVALRGDGSLVAWGDNGFGQTNCPQGNHYVMVHAGAWHSVALKGDGSIVAWGNNQYGQTDPPGGDNYVAVSAGDMFSVALKEDGSLVAWGDNNYGQTDCPAGDDYAAVACGREHAMALKRDGSLLAWGANTDGQANCPAGTNYVAVTCGRTFSIALRTDRTSIAITNPASVTVMLPYTQTLYRVVATNMDIVGTMAVVVNGCVTNWYPAANPFTCDVALAIGPNLVRVVGTNSLGEEAADGVMIERRNAAGALRCWGNSEWRNKYRELMFPCVTDCVAATLAETFCVALKSNGSLAIWPDDIMLQYYEFVGVGYKGDTNCPAGDGFVAVSAGERFGVALTTNGTVVAWGDNGSGQTNCPANGGYVAVAAGDEHCVAVRDDGSLVAWGRSDYSYGQTNCPAGNDYIAVVAGNDFSVALRKDGSLVGWGSNDRGETNCPEGNDYIALAASGWKAYALKADGSMVMWGDSTECPTGTDYVAISSYTGLRKNGAVDPSYLIDPAGMIYCEVRGDNHVALAQKGACLFTIDNPCISITNQRGIYLPYSQAQWTMEGVMVGIAGDVAVIVNHRRTNWFAAASTFSYVVDLDMGRNIIGVVGTNSAGEKASDAIVVVRRNPPGEPVAWGLDGDGQPLACPPGTNYVAVSGGHGFSIALRDDGSLVGWGINDQGQVNCPEGNNYSAVAAGATHAIALKDDGTIISWGSQPQSQYGYGNENIAISAAGNHSIALNRSGWIWGWTGGFPSGYTNYPSGSGYVAIDAGDQGDVALRQDGSIAGYGDKGYYAPTGSNFIAVATGDWTDSRAIRADGTMVYWHPGFQYELPESNYCTVDMKYNTVALQSDGNVFAGLWSTDWSVNAGWGGAPPGDDYVAVAAGDHHGVAIKLPSPTVTITNPSGVHVMVPFTQTQCEIAGYAEEAVGSMGIFVNHGATNWRAAASPFTFTVDLVPGPNLVTVIATNSMGWREYATRMVVRRAPQGALWAWGDNSNGLLDCPAGNDYVSVAGQNTFAVALRADGSLVAWGDNTYGQTNCPSDTNFIAVAAGGIHGLALRDDGSVVGWGNNDQGQTDCPAGNDFVAVAAGDMHSMALRADGTLVSWGSNSHGQTNIPPGNFYVTVAAGQVSSMAMRSDGGLDERGFLQRWTPIMTIGKGFIDIASGPGHDVLLRRDGSLALWTYNDSPTFLPTGTNYGEIACGMTHDIALGDDGMPVAWNPSGYVQTNFPAGLAYSTVAAGYGVSFAIAPMPMPFIDITNDAVTVSNAVDQYAVAGTNNVLVVGNMWVSNAANAAVTQFVAAATWTAPAVSLVEGLNTIRVTGSNVWGVVTNDSVNVVRMPHEGSWSDVELFSIGRGADYGQVSLAWSNGTVTVLACTNRTYPTGPTGPTSPTGWFVLAAGVSPPWTHTAASNYAAVYYRIVSGTFTSRYDVGKFDVNVRSGSIAWISFPFATQPGCDSLSEWFGLQLNERSWLEFNFPSLQQQDGPGGTIQNSDYYIDDGDTGTTNWFPDRLVAPNAGYVLFLPSDHGAVKVTGMGMVPTNDVSMQVPYRSIPWIGLAYPVRLDMRQSGLAGLLVPVHLYSSFDYDYIDSQETPGGPVCYAEYYVDDWGTGATNFFPSVAGADYIEGGKGYLLFFGTGRVGTGVWNCARPY